MKKAIVPLYGSNNTSADRRIIKFDLSARFDSWSFMCRFVAVSIVEQSISNFEPLSPAAIPCNSSRYTVVTCDPSGSMVNTMSCSPVSEHSSQCVETWQPLGDFPAREIVDRDTSTKSTLPIPSFHRISFWSTQFESTE
jgi:hypothetical protein